MSTALRIAVVFVLVLGNAVFVAAEYALVTARRSRLEERAEHGGRGAKTALRLMDEPVRFISTVQVGITVLSIALGVVGEPLVSQYFEFLPRGVAFVVSFSVLTYLSVVLGELVPKAVALQKAELLALFPEIPAADFDVVLTPINTAAVPAAARDGMHRFVFLLAGTVGLLMLAGCLAAGMLLLVRTESRRHELVTARALGASCAHEPGHRGHGDWCERRSGAERHR